MIGITHLALYLEAAGPDAQRPAPGEQLEELGADQLAAPAFQHPDGGFLASSACRLDGADDLGLRGDENGADADLQRGLAHERLRERDQRRVLGADARRLERRGRRLALGAARDCLEQLAPAALARG